MQNRKICIRLGRSSISVFLAEILIFLLLFSELIFYLGIKETSFISGIHKTYLYLVILLCGILSLTKCRKHFDKSIRVFLCFSVITCISTTLGITPDIALWRQCIHLLVFASLIIIFYVGTEIRGDEINIRFLYCMLIIFIGMLFFAFGNLNSSIANSVYYILMFVPLISFIDKNLIRKILYIIISIIVLLSNKRTALLAIIAYFFIGEFVSNRNMNGRKKVYKVIGYILLFVVLFFIFPYFINKFNITVFKELSEAGTDGGSNRLYIYSQLWQAQVHGNAKHWIIGNGYNSVLLSHICTDGVGGGWVSAHNDFLEVLYDYGIVGFILYIAFFVELIKKSIQMILDEYKYAYSFMGSIVFIIIISMTSHLIIYLNYYALVIIFWSICLAHYQFWRQHRDFIEE